MHVHCGDHSYLSLFIGYLSDWGTTQHAAVLHSAWAAILNIFIDKPSITDLLINVHPFIRILMGNIKWSLH